MNKPIIYCIVFLGSEWQVIKARLVETGGQDFKCVETYEEGKGFRYEMVEASQVFESMGRAIIRVKELHAERIERLMEDLNSLSNKSSVEVLDLAWVDDDQGIKVD